MKRNARLAAVISAAGLLITAAACFAESLGLDPSAGWGPSRIALLALGIFVLLLGLVFWISPRRVLESTESLAGTLRGGPGAASLRPAGSGAGLRRMCREYWFVLPAIAAVVFIYLWFATSGALTNWDSPTRYYADLARGFLRGNLHMATREWQMDYSHYQGKFYLYFGPVPALLLALILPVVKSRVGDLQLVFAFLTLTYVALCLLAVEIWDRHFRDLPRYLLWSMLPLLGLAGPAAFMLNNHMAGRIYEAAIAGGQMFLVAGFLAALTTLRRPVSPWRLAPAGCLWALAIGSRLTLLLPVAFMVFMVAAWVLTGNRRWVSALSTLIPLSLPLVLVLGGLGWYNWARFGSVFESGFFYQNVGFGMEFKGGSSDLFNPLYIPQNLYNYLLLPPETQREFPYLVAPYGRTAPLFPFYALPPLYAAQQITGLLYAAPFLVFAAIPAAAMIRTFRRTKTIPIQPDGATVPGLNWVTLTLSGACLVIGAALLSFFWAAARYCQDAMPLLLMLAAAGFWQGHRSAAGNPLHRRWYTGLGLVLAGASIITSTLIALAASNASLSAMRLLQFIP